MIFADGTAALAQVIADYWPYLATAIVSALGLFSRWAYFGLRWLGVDVIKPNADKLTEAGIGVVDKHKVFVDEVSSAVKQSSIASQRSAEAAEQSATGIAEISNGTRATLELVRRIAEFQAEHMKVCRGELPKGASFPRGRDRGG